MAKSKPAAAEPTAETSPQADAGVPLPAASENGAAAEAPAAPQDEPEWPGPGVQPGRVVHYVGSGGTYDPVVIGEIRPAIIVEVVKGLNSEHQEVAGCNLAVLLNGPLDHCRAAGGGWGCGPLWLGTVRYSSAPKAGTWHWPPRG